MRGSKRMKTSTECANCTRVRVWIDNDWHEGTFQAEPQGIACTSPGAAVKNNQTIALTCGRVVTVPAAYYRPLPKFEKIEEYSRAAHGVPDSIDFDLELLVVGCNPGCKSGQEGHHYAGPTNHFWHIMRNSGLVPEMAGPNDDAALLQSHRIGFTNICKRVTRTGADLSKNELQDGALQLYKKILFFRPKFVLFNGITVYKTFLAYTAPTLHERYQKLVGSDRLGACVGFTRIQRQQYAAELKERMLQLRDHL